MKNAQKLQMPSKEMYLLASKIYADAQELSCLGKRCKDAYNAYKILCDSYDFNNHVAGSEPGCLGLDRCSGEAWTEKKYDVIKFYTESAIPQSSCFAIATKDGIDYLINPQGEEIFSCEEIRPGDYYIFPVICKVRGKLGAVDSTGSYVAIPEYDSIFSLSDGFLKTVKNGKYGFIDPWNELFPAIYDSVDFNKQGWLEVVLEGEKGYINRFGEFTEDENKASYHREMMY